MKFFLGHLKDFSIRHLLYIENDYLASYNERYGREGGDIVLAEAAHRIEKVIPETMSFHREGGDEFIIFTETTDLDVVKVVLEGILQAAEEPIKIGEEWVKFNMSMGVGQMNAEAAREQMLTAKLAARNRYICE